MNTGKPELWQYVAHLNRIKRDAQEWKRFSSLSMNEQNAEIMEYWKKE